MMKHEFEALAGYEVSFEDYDKIIEPMYMATNLNKAEFVKTLNRKAFDLNEKKKEMVKEMKAIAAERKENAEHFCNYEAEDRLQELAHQYAEIFHRFSTPEIARKQTYQTFGCSYPSEVIFYQEVVNGHYYAAERIKLA